MKKYIISNFVSARELVTTLSLCPGEAVWVNGKEFNVISL